MTATRNPNWCDHCEQEHTDLKATHCVIGEHCVTIQHGCAGRAEFNNHGAVCCACGTSLSEKYRAQTDTSDSPAAQVRRIQTY